MNNSTLLKHCSQFLIAAAGLAFVTIAHAAALSWDTVAGDGAAITPGSGLWKTGSTNWNNGATNVNWANGDTATFGGADGAYTIDVQGPISLGSGVALSFTNSGYSLSAVTATNAQNISLANKIISVTVGDTATIRTNVTLNRNAGSTTARDVAISGGGTLVIDAGASLTQANANASEIGSGSTLRLTGGNISLLASLVIGKLDTSVNTNGQLIVDSGILTVGGSGNLVPGRVAGEVCGFIINGGTVTVNAGQVRTDNGTATMNFNGGVVSTRQVARAAGTSALTFNGGTLKVSSSASAAQKADFISSLSSATINSGGATIDPNGQAITIGQALLAGTGNGGLTLNDTAAAKGSLTLSGANTYAGPTILNAGTLIVPTPYSAISSPVVNNGGKLRVIVSGSSSDFGSPLTLNDGGRTEFYLGAYNPANVPGITNANLVVPNGTTNFIDIIGTDIPVTNIVLLSYTNKTGTGTFQLGTLPPAMAATLTDSGSQLILNVTAPSANVYTWSVGTGNWEIGGALNWNSGAAAYAEPAVVIFPDSAGGTVTITTNVAPSDVDVVVTNAGIYTFTGTGSIGGATGMDILGISTVTLGNSNAFTGPVTISGGSGTVGAYVTVTHSNALGATSGGTVVNGPANTLALGNLDGAGITVSGEAVSIAGTGIGGAKGALRGSAVAAGETNVWAGPVIIGANEARMGTEDSGNLTVSGTITDNGTNYGVVFRPGNAGQMLVNGVGNNWGGNTTIYGEFNTGSTVKSGRENVFPTNRFIFIGNCTLDLNGFNQTATGLGLGGSATAGYSILGNSGSAATFTLNGTNNSSFPGDVTGSLALVKEGTNTHSFNGANLTYAGNTTVNGGRLNLSSANSLATSITVNGGAALGGEFTTTGSLTLNANATLYVDSATPASINAASVSAPSSPVLVAFSVAPTPGVPALVLASPSAMPINPANFQLAPGSGLRGGNFYLTNSGTELVFAATSAASLVWKGNSPTNATFWDVTTTTNWNNAGNPDVFFTSDPVLFNDSASTFNVAVQGASVSPSSVTFQNHTNAYTVSGGAIAGTGALLMAGSNTVTLASANTYSGGTTVTNTGTLVVNQATGLGTGAATVESGSTLQLNSTLSGTTSFTNTFLGTGTLRVLLSTDSAANTTLPNVAGFAGTIILANDGNTGDKFNISAPTISSATLQIQNSNTLYLATNVSFSSITLLGTGNNESRGAIRLGSAGASLGGNLSLLGDTAIGSDSAAATIAGDIYGTASAGSTNVLTQGSVSAAGCIISGVISDGPNGGKVALVQKNGTLTLTGNNTYTGPTTVSAANLRVNGNQSAATGPVSVAGGATLGGTGTLGGAVTLNSGARLLPGSGDIGTLTVAALVLTNGVSADFEITDVTTLDQVVVTASGGLSFTGGGVNLYQSGTTNAFTDNGTYTLFQYTGALPGGAANVPVLNAQPGKTYVVFTNASTVQVTIADAPTPIYWGVDADGSWNNTGNWSPTTVPNAQFVTANFGGAGSPAFTGPHAVTLDSIPTAGSVVFDTPQSFTVNAGSGGPLQLNNGAALAVLNQVSGSHAIAAPLALPALGASITVATNTTLALGGTVSGSGGITKSAPGAVVVSGVNNYNGLTTASAGRLVVSNNAALGSTVGATLATSGGSVELANGIVVTGETITVNGFGPNARGALQVALGSTAEWAGPVILGAGTGDSRVGAQSNATLIISGVISAGTLTSLVASADPANGRVIISGTANTYPGESQVIRGTLALGAHNALPIASVLNLDSASSTSDDGTLDLNGFNQELGGIRRGNTGGNFAITNSSATLATLTVNNTNAYTFSPPIAGNLALVKSGAAGLTLSGTNAYTGNTTVNAGTLALAQATLATNFTITVTNGASLQLDFAVTNRVGALVLNGVTQTNGIYSAGNVSPYLSGVGALQVGDLASPVPATGTNLSFSVGGGQLTLSWPSNYVGWYLQVQTNSRSVGLSNNWVTIPGTEAVTQTNFPVTAINPAVFFRMVHTNTP